MSIAISEEHQELARVVRTFLASHDARAESRAMLDEDSERMPSFWKEMAELGWMGLHIEESCGGQGFGLAELAIVIEELGHAMAPGPYLPTTLAAAVLSETLSETFSETHEAVRSDFLPRLADGSSVGAVGWAGALELSAAGVLNGSAGLVLGAGLADVLLLPVGDDMVVVERDQGGLSIEPLENIDQSRRVCAVTCRDVRVAPERVLRNARGPTNRLIRTG